MDNTVPHVPERREGFTTRIPSADSELTNRPLSHSFLLPPIEPDELGRLGNYRVLRLLGKGGMGLVFHAEDIALRRPVALKVLKPDLAKDVCGWERFLREARTMASIKHESLVTVFQVGQEQGVVYLAMELLEGRSLEGWLAYVGQPASADILRVGREIVSGLAAIHRRGLIHRDVKPANLWVEEPTGRVKILDFGLARFVNDDASLTQTGAILGTPAFMAPEQARGEQVDARSDLFSLGCVLYTLCTGTDPFSGTNTTAVLTALATRDPSPVHHINAAIPRALSDLVTQLLAKQPEHRPASAEAVLERLEQIERGGPDTSKKRTQGLKAKANSTSGRFWAKVSAAIVVGVVVGVVPWLAAPLFRSGANGTPPAEHRTGNAGPVVAEHRQKPLGPPALVPGTQAKVYLSDLAPLDKENWPFRPPPPPQGKGPNDDGDGPPDGPPRKKGPPKFSTEVTVQGQVSPHGIFMHPPPAWEGPASATYQLRGEFKTFHVKVSMNDGPPRSEEPFLFAIYGDGRLLWKSKEISGQADAQTCTVPVQGVERLKIEVRSTGEPKAAHAVWLEPYLAR